MSSYVVYNYCVNAAVTLYFYERVLTIDQEINLVWRRAPKLLFMPALYVSMHICSMVYLLLEIVPWGSGKWIHRRSHANYQYLCPLSHLGSYIGIACVRD
ncbi:uncharacterized protein B0H18DRAFT_63176 [Fomitopsis serialis]|uniref:uncharacterized protein n=1 Tax=Fomitopsis serialis TaxID=139415 RepID=UPI002007E515|nr:uncharacterized protein B0H18DRAFT_63176 [Neoantrodia serialis]KAH9916640.1 hypothetical protein B0H18DRAFT_63176 [Neoantrodia serialis]